MKAATGIGALVDHWRLRAEDLRTYGAAPQATALEECARELEDSLNEVALQPLTLGEAAELSGYSTDHLGRLIRDGRIPNAGRHNAPRIRRADLPIKPRTRELPVAADPSLPHTTNAQVVQSIIEGVG